MTNEDLAALVAEAEKRADYKIGKYFKDEGPHRRELYAKHLLFFAAGSLYKERLFMAANRVGKSESGAFETTCHLTGDYPHWWEGRRFTKPVQWWACGTTSETTRDIVQEKLCGGINQLGLGMIPSHLIIHHTKRPHGLPGSLEQVWVRHASGGLSTIGFKAYEQGRQSFEGTARDGVWCDEEPPQDCYTEMLYRTMTTEGIIYTTFTPLQGMSVVNMAGGEIVPAAQRGVIDCAEWVGGVEDLRLGLHQVFKYHYTPGMHENNSIGELGFNLDVWKGFTPAQQDAVNSAVNDTFIAWLTRWQKQNADAIEELVQKHGVQIRRTPPDILIASLKSWDQVAAENSAKSPTFKKVYESQREYAAKVVPAKRYMSPPYSFAANYYWPQEEKPAAKKAAK